MQDNADYWRNRHKQRYGALTSVGDIRRSEEENLELYAYKKRNIVQALQELQLLDLRGKRVLDVGCGIGLLSEVFWMLGAEVYGLDASVDALDFARRRAPGGDFRCDVVSNFNFGCKFDLIVCADVLYHIIDETAWEKALALFVQHMLPSGYLIIGEQLKGQEDCPSSHVHFRTRVHYVTAAATLQLRLLQFPALHPTLMILQPEDTLHSL